MIYIHDCKILPHCPLSFEKRKTRKYFVNINKIELYSHLQKSLKILICYLAWGALYIKKPCACTHTANEMVSKKMFKMNYVLYHGITAKEKRSYINDCLIFHNNALYILIPMWICILRKSHKFRKKNTRHN